MTVNNKKLQTSNELKELAGKHMKKRNEGDRVVAVCAGSGCQAGGASGVAAEFKKILSSRFPEYRVLETGCHGFCERGPLVIIRPEGYMYQKVKISDVARIIDSTIAKGGLLKDLLYRDSDGRFYERELDLPFYKNQKRIVFSMNGHIDPREVGDYMSMGGYLSLAGIFSGMKPEEIISEIKASGLRGRGGGGFPAGLKWESCRRAPGGEKYVICNADEGDPGAFMDRSILEGNPHSVIEGMIACAYAVGSSSGIIYVRNEYPLAIRHLGIALEQCHEYGILGFDILGSGFSFDIRIVRGGGAFVCGESTALMNSVEGKVGRPRPKYIHSVEKGLRGKPTVLNNVETFANVPWIINKGSAWYASTGTGDVSVSPWGGSKGTKVFSLVGKVNNTGLVEVPMGTTLREIIFNIGGGVKNSKKGRVFKAVQTGGPSGGCIPEEHLDSPVDYDKLTALGSMMGSGGMIVMDDRNCMVELARYYVEFLKEESCGKCVPCREGLKRMSEILSRITGGSGRPGDIELLQSLGKMMSEASLCGLGQSAANPVLSTIRYFRSEYEQHIEQAYCSAGQCASITRYYIDGNLCTGCAVCAKRCPAEAISGSLKETHFIDADKCVACGVCFDVCSFAAVKTDAKKTAGVSDV